MAFQDNSGDIIFDVVLTDEGRRRLAAADGSFQVTKFALGDDEVNYNLYNYAASTAQQDLTILQTPVLEAFTNNMSSMKSKLMTLGQQNIRYLPILKLNSTAGGAETFSTLGNFVVAVNDVTQDGQFLSQTSSIGFAPAGTRALGVLFGQDPSQGGGYIRVDAGIDSTNITSINPNLIETEFQIEIDDRLGSLVDIDGGLYLSYVTVDDDNIATYLVSSTANPEFVITPSQAHFNNTNTPINGPLASALQFKIAAAPALRDSNFLFDRIGSRTAIANATAGNTTNCRTIDTIVRVSGITTGYAIDIPVRFAKVP